MHTIIYFTNRLKAIEKILTGYVLLGFPVFIVYIVLNASKASSLRPFSSKNLGLSTKKAAAMPHIKDGTEEMKRNKRQVE